MMIRKKYIPIFMAFTFFFLFIFPGLLFSQAEREKKMQEEGAKVESPAFSIEENLKKFKAKLEALETKYSECCGSLLNVYVPMDANKIMENLPKPKTLTVNLSYPLPPWKRTEQVPKNRVFLDSFSEYDTRLYAPFPFSLGRGQAWVYGDRSITWPWRRPVAAVDKETSILLGIANEVGLRIRGGFFEEKDPEKSACCTDPKWDGSDFKNCKRVAMLHKYPSLYEVDVRRIKLKVDIKGGGEVLGGGSGIKFTQPGYKEVGFESPMKIDFNSKYCTYINCVHSYPALDKCEPAGTVKFPEMFGISAVKLKAFGISGLDFEGGTPQLDYFITAGDRNFPAYKFIRPAVLLDDGEKQERVYGLGEIMTTSYGPISLTIEDEYTFTLSYLGGIGSTKFKSKHSYLETKEHEITVNAIEMVYDPVIKEISEFGVGRKNIITAGRKYKITVLVSGPANMKSYSVAWRMKDTESLKDAEIGITWDKEKTEFNKTGEIWSSSNMFQINYKGYKPANNPIRFVIESRIQRNSDNQHVFINEKVLHVSHPAIAELRLFGSTDGKTFSEPPSGIDIFIAPLAINFKSRGVFLYPYVVLTDKSLYPLNEVTQAMVELKHTNPGVVKTSSYTDKDLKKDMLKVDGVSAGRTDITVRIGKDLQKEVIYGVYGITQGDEVVSKPVRLNVNVIQPVTVDIEGKNKTYRLSIESPTYFENKYRVVWIGKNGRTVTPFVDEGFYSNAALTTDSEITGIQIIDGKSEVVAELGVHEKTSVGRVKLLPPEIPVTTVGKQDLVDYSSLESLNQCIETITFGIKHMGFEPGKTPEEYCRQDRKEKKEELKKIRESQKEMNKLVKELDKQGKEMVVFADKATVAAVVEVPAYFDKKALFCFWRLIDAHAQIMLQDQVSPIQWATESKGGCFNVVSGIQKYLTPEAKVQVELRMDTIRQKNVDVVSPVEKWGITSQTLYKPVGGL